MKKILLAGIRSYQFFSKDLAWWGSSCVFHPSCSDYGHEAIEKYGIVKGVWLTLRRILRCRPGKSFSIDFLP